MILRSYDDMVKKNSPKDLYNEILNKYNLQIETQSDMPAYVTREEFDAIINQLNEKMFIQNILISWNNHEKILDDD